MCFFNKDSGEQANLIAASSKHTKGIGIRCSPGGSDLSGWPWATVIPLGCLVNVNGMSIKCAVELARAGWCSMVVELRKRKGEQEVEAGEEGFDVPEGPPKSLCSVQRPPPPSTPPPLPTNPPLPATLKGEEIGAKYYCGYLYSLAFFILYCTESVSVRESERESERERAREFEYVGECPPCRQQFVQTVPDWKTVRGSGCQSMSMVDAAMAAAAWWGGREGPSPALAVSQKRCLHPMTTSLPQEW